MRVVCETLDEFLTDLENEELVQKAIRVTITSHTDDDTVFDVNFQASAIVYLPDSGEYLIEVGVDCGKDFKDATQNYEGSDNAAELKQRVRDFCKGHSLSLRPGLIVE